MSRDQAPRPTGRVSARVVGAARILRQRARSCRESARAYPEQDAPFAAALRGKAKGLEEAALLVERLDRGLPLNTKHDRWFRRLLARRESVGL